VPGNPGKPCNSDRPDKPIGPIGPARLYLLLCLGLAIGLFLIVRWGNLNGFTLVDGRVYADSLNLWVSGKSPYDVAFGAYRFIYPPVFLFVGGVLTRLMPLHWGWPLYLAVNYASTVALPVVLARFVFRQSWLNSSFALLVFLAAPQFDAWRAMESANIACPLYLLAFAGAIPGLKKNRWLWFYLAVIAVSLIKVNFLLMLMLPFFVGKRQMVRSCIAGAAVMAAYLLQRMLAPGLYAGYERSLHYVVVGQDNYGFGVFGIIANLDLKFHHSVGVAPYLGMGALLLMLVIGLWCLRARIGPAADEGGNGGVWATLVIVAILLANPRSIYYDRCFATEATLVLLVHVFTRNKPLFLYLILFLASALTAIFPWSLLLDRALETVLLLGVFAAMYRKLWLESGATSSIDPVLVLES
jgi:hypothetical protein